MNASLPSKRKTTAVAPLRSSSAIALVDAPPGIAAVFAQRPLALDEKADEYDAMLAAFVGALEPSDAVEWLWAKDLTDAAWESLRARRMKSKLLERAEHEGIAKATVQAIERWVAETGDDKVTASRRHEVDEIRAETSESRISDFLTRMSLGVDRERACAEAYRDTLGQLERLDRLLAAADNRRERVLREIDRRRDSATRRRLVDLQLAALQQKEDQPILVQIARFSHETVLDERGLENEHPSTSGGEPP